MTVKGKISNNLSRRTRIKILLIQAGIRQQDLVERYGFHKAAVSLVISGKRRTRRIRKAIARELGVSVEEIFGNDGDESRQPKVGNQVGNQVGNRHEK